MYHWHKSLIGHTVFLANVSSSLPPPLSLSLSVCPPPRQRHTTSIFYSRQTREISIRDLYLEKYGNSNTKVRFVGSRDFPAVGCKFIGRTRGGK